MKQIREIYGRLNSKRRVRIAVAAAADREVLASVAMARDFADALLFGDEKMLRSLCAEFSLPETCIRHADSPQAAAEAAAQSVADGECQILMKGMLPSGMFIRTLLDRRYGLRAEGNVMHAVAGVEVENEGQRRVIFLTDPGFLPAPELAAKEKMIDNLLPVLHRLGFACPKIAVLSASESVNPKMVSSTDADALREMNLNGRFPDCIVEGPLSLDLALSPHSAAHKGVQSRIMGDADVILVPSIEVGNALLKSLTLFLNPPTCGLVCGVKIPVVFTSRSDTPETKRNTIAMAALLAEGV